METAHPETPADQAPEATGAPAPEAVSAQAGILLEEPIRRGETLIDRVSLRRPSAGEMRGLQLQGLMQGDVNAVLAMLPRITVPPLTLQEVETIGAADFAVLSGEVSGFFMSRAERAMIAKVMGAIDPETSTG